MYNPPLIADFPVATHSKWRLFYFDLHSCLIYIAIHNLNHYLTALHQYTSFPVPRGHLHSPTFVQGCLVAGCQDFLFAHMGSHCSTSETSLPFALGPSRQADTSVVEQRVPIDHRWVSPCFLEDFLNYLLQLWFDWGLTFGWRFHQFCHAVHEQCNICQNVLQQLWHVCP